MAFQCGGDPIDIEKIERQQSNFGDAYSVKTRSTNGGSLETLSRFHDEPEADYDEGATDLYRCIENKNWDGALSRLEIAPIEAKTWVYRKEYSSNKIRWRLLPLHAVCIFRAPLALIEALIEVYRDGPQMKDDQGMLPVHLACRNGASKGVVLTLLNAFPDSIYIVDRKGRSVTSLVQASNSANKEAVLSALRRFEKEMSTSGSMTHTPRAETPPPAPTTTTTTTTVNEVDYEHRTLLFRLILKKDWKGVCTRAATTPSEAATFIVTKGFNGNLRFLPLHKACVLQPPVEAIDALLKAFNDAAKAKDQDGWLPLHCASFYGANDKVLSALLAANPKAAQSKDDDGHLPLHYACLKGASPKVVDVLLASFAKGSLCKDDEGRLPIHHACSKGAPESVIEALLKASPKGAQSKDDQGRLPLHHACRKNASERVLRTLLRVYPRAAQVKDDQDKLPIHYACGNGASASAISLLLTTYPESIDVKNGFGYTPLAEVKALENPDLEPVVKVLEKFKKEQDKIKANMGNSNASVETKVSMLQDKILRLERTLGKVADLGKDMRSDLKKGKDPEDVLDKFAQCLVDLGNGGSGSRATPLKQRQVPTPSKGLFGRVKGNKTTKAK